jgi:hypothetical protein
MIGHDIDGPVRGTERDAIFGMEDSIAKTANLYIECHDFSSTTALTPRSPPRTSL